MGDLQRFFSPFPLLKIQWKIFASLFGRILMGCSIFVTGFRAIGCGIFLSAGSAFLINLALSRKTRPVNLLSAPFFLNLIYLNKLIVSEKQL